ncbi:unnamed protein product [Protopolystoma xenopodis]|uniref:Uncharacterized protein n=1 Tax=Protopolystoma xenopodis TaxID=117903 RepID=A0A448XIU1_9PLAT|nr:unnamed protein product [Protopolystoma xenopodis]
MPVSATKLQLVKNTLCQGGHTITHRFVLVLLSISYPLVSHGILANLPWRHHTCYLPCSPHFRVADPTRASCPYLLRVPVGPFLVFLAD